jgi:hypothetical protein
LGLDILRAYDASVDIGRQALWLAEEEVSIRSPGEGPCPSSLVVAKDHVIPTQCEGIVMAWMENPLSVENGLVELSPQAHPPEGIYIARTLFQDRQSLECYPSGSEAHERIPSGTLWASHVGDSAQCGAAEAQDLGSKLEDVITAARPHLTNEVFRELEELTIRGHFCWG